MKKYKVVFHIDEGTNARAELVFNNIENLIADVGQEDVEIELVSNSEGVRIFLGTPGQHASRIETLAAKGVRLVACANSLRKLGFAPDSLFNHVEVVSSGVSELVKKQTDGWAYIRP